MDTTPRTPEQIQPELDAAMERLNQARQRLLDNFDALRSGRVSPADAKAVTKEAGAISREVGRLIKEAAAGHKHRA